MSLPIRKVLRATMGSYFVLCGVWVLLGLGYLFLNLRNQGAGLETGAIIALGIAILWSTWLQGFRLSISECVVEYRDGFFRTARIPFREIAEIKDGWVEWPLSRRIRVPRILIVARDGETVIRINPKPFALKDLKVVREMLKAEVSATRGMKAMQ